MYDWSVMSSLNADNAYKLLINVITECLDKYVPKKLIKLRLCDKFREPWMSVKYKRFNLKSRKLCQRARVSGTLADTIKYRTYHNTLTRLKMYEKQVHYEHVFKKVQKNSKLLWNILNGIIKKSNDKSGITELFYDNQTLNEPEKICNAFNSHFSSAGEQTRNTINMNGPRREPTSYMTIVNNALLFEPVSETYICKIVKALKSKRSSGYDDISNVLLKDLVDVLKVPLCIVFNKSLLSGHFPDLMKITKVIPLHKGGQRNVPDNYRPISLLPVISKVLERIVYNFLVNHLESNNIVYSCQFGLRRNHSTSDGIMSFLGNIMQAMDNKSMILSIFIDLKKAFDTIPHSIILDKLKTLGVKGTEFEWFSSYMSSRRQFVNLQNCKSDMNYTNIGVQQGSLLGVLLFQILINDLPKCLKFSTGILFADDTTILLYGKSLRFLKLKMQADLDNLSCWLRSNCLKLNVAKTKLLLINAEGLAPNVSLTLEGQEIENVTEFKFLGIYLDNRLSFEYHFFELYKKLSQFHFIIRKLKSVLPQVCLPSLYFGYFHSNLVYGLPIWYPLLSKKSQNSLTIAQKKIVRAICGVARTQHCMPLFRKLVILMISDQLTLENCKLIQHIELDICPTPIANLFHYGTHSQYNTRSGSLRIVQHSSVKLNNSFLCKAIADWSKLDGPTKSLKCIKPFVNVCKKKFIKRY